jgi:ABC-type lipoprotein release transport system permease subunit
MALGATARDIGRLVLLQSAGPVGLGLAAGGAVAAALAIVLTSIPAASRIARVVDVFDPPAYVIGVLFIATACLLSALFPARRAARIDPNDTLRQD